MREEQYSGIPREHFEFCDCCGKKIPYSQVAGKCSVCKGLLCSDCVVEYQGRIYCKAHAPAPPKPEKTGCFIATAAYGTPLAKEIDVLRSFRDKSMNKHVLGKKLVAIYYQVSPKIAHVISKSQLRQKIVRFFLNPLVRIFKKLRY
jgi:hypothetical protein